MKCNMKNYMENSEKSIDYRFFCYIIVYTEFRNTKPKVYKYEFLHKDKSVKF